jgi:hypothetical protein
MNEAKDNYSNIPLFIFDMLILPINIIRVFLIYLYGSKYGIKGFRFLDVIMHANSPYFNQNYCKSVNTINDDYRGTIYNDTNYNDTKPAKNVEKQKIKTYSNDSMIIGAINTSDNMWDKWISFDDDTVPNKVDKSTDTIVLNQDNVAINIVPDKIDKTIADINNSEKINKKEIFSSDSNKNMNNGFKKKSKTKTNNKNIMNYNVLDSIKDELDSAFDSD